MGLTFKLKDSGLNGFGASGVGVCGVQGVEGVLTFSIRLTCYTSTDEASFI